MLRWVFIIGFVLSAVPVWAQTNGGANEVAPLSEGGALGEAKKIAAIDEKIRQLEASKKGKTPAEIAKIDEQIDKLKIERAKAVAAQKFFEQQAQQAQNSANHNNQGDGKKQPAKPEEKKPEEKKDEKKNEPKTAENQKIDIKQFVTPEQMKDADVGGGSRGATQTASNQGNAQKNLTQTQSEINERRLAQAQAEATATQTNNLVAMKKQIDGLQGNLDSKFRPATNDRNPTVGEKLLLASTASPDTGGAARSLASLDGVSPIVRAVMSDHAEARAVSNYLQQSNHLARGSFPR